MLNNVIFPRFRGNLKVIFALLFKISLCVCVHGDGLYWNSGMRLAPRPGPARQVVLVAWDPVLLHIVKCGRDLSRNNSPALNAKLHYNYTQFSYKLGLHVRSMGTRPQYCICMAARKFLWTDVPTRNVCYVFCDAHHKDLLFYNVLYRTVCVLVHTTHFMSHPGKTHTVTI